MGILDLSFVGVNKVGNVTNNESFPSFKSKEHCWVTARVDACDQHHLQRANMIIAELTFVIVYN